MNFFTIANFLNCSIKYSNNRIDKVATVLKYEYHQLLYCKSHITSMEICNQKMVLIAVMVYCKHVFICILSDLSVKHKLLHGSYISIT